MDNRDSSKRAVDARRYAKLAGARHVEFTRTVLAKRNLSVTNSALRSANSRDLPHKLNAANQAVKCDCAANVGVVVGLHGVDE